VIENTDQLAASSRSEKLRKWFVSRGVVRACWIVNALLLVATWVWILRDGLFAQGLAAFQAHLAAFGNEKSPLAVVPPLMWSRVDALWGILIGGTLSMAIIIAGLVAGSGIHRGTRAWLVLMLLVAAWLTLSVTWREVACHGLRWRASRNIEEFEKLANRLSSNWPERLEYYEDLGTVAPLHAKDIKKLVILHYPVIPGTCFKIQYAEREEQTLYFHLANYEKAWLIRQNDDSLPRHLPIRAEGDYVRIPSPAEQAKYKQGTVAFNPSYWTHGWRIHQIGPNWYVASYVRPW
jgi:hypothetical protein